jgi:Skp family chaperone for outer membrane proteins
MGAQGAASAQAADPARTTTSTPATTPAGTAQGGASRPLLPPGIREYFLDQDVALAGASTAAQYQPQILGKARLHYLDNRLGIDQWLDAGWIAPLDAEANEVLWREGLAQDASRLSLSAQRLAELPFATPAGPALRPANYARWVKSFTLHLQEHERYNAWFCELLKLVSAPGETEAQFRQRLLQPLREKRDELVDALRRKYAPKLLALQDRVARAEDRLRREQDQLQQQKLGAALSVGASILGAVLGRKVFSSGNIGRASSAVRSASRIGRESGDVQRADETLEELRQRWEALQEECEAEVAALSATIAADTVALREMTLAPRKSDLVVKEVALVWIPGPAR